MIKITITKTILVFTPRTITVNISIKINRLVSTLPDDNYKDNYNENYISLLTKGR